MNTAPEPEFDQCAHSYDEALQQGLRFSGEGKDYFAQKRVDWLGERLSEHGKNTPAVILDYGCGTGGSIPFLQKRFKEAHVLGVDVSRESLVVARRAHSAAKATFFTPDERSPCGEADLVFCNGVFHHIPPAGRAACIRYIHNSLKPGGVFAFWENNPWNPGTRFIMSRVPFDRDAITLNLFEARKLVRSGGFSVEHSDFLFIFPKILSFLRWIERPLSPLPLGGQYLLFGVKDS